VALSKARTHGGEAEGGGEELRQKMTTRRVRVEGEGRRKKKVDFAAQCQDPENNNPVFLLLLSTWEIFFLSQKMVDCACVSCCCNFLFGCMTVFLCF
jgi:hypothetical protein